MGLRGCVRGGEGAVSEDLRDAAAGPGERGRLKLVGEGADGFGGVFGARVGFGLGDNERFGTTPGHEASVDEYSLASHKRAIAYGRARGQA